MKCPYCGNEVVTDQPGSSGDGVHSIQCKHCGNWVLVNHSGFAKPTAMTHSEPLPTHSAEAAADPFKIRGEKAGGGDIGKYFLHGLAFSVLMFGVLMGWVFVLAFLFVIGSVIGLIVGIVILIYVMGWLNVNLTQYLWHIRVDSEWTALLVHGLVLFIALLLVSIPQLILSTLIPSIITTIVLFIVYCFVDGFVAKNLAEKVF